MINHDSSTLDPIIEAYKGDQRRGRGLRKRPIIETRSLQRQRPSAGFPGSAVTMRSCASVLYAQQGDRQPYSA